MTLWNIKSSELRCYGVPRWRRHDATFVTCFDYSTKINTRRLINTSAISIKLSSYRRVYLTVLKIDQEPPKERNCSSPKPAFLSSEIEFGEKRPEIYDRGNVPRQMSITTNLIFNRIHWGRLSALPAIERVGHSYYRLHSCLIDFPRHGRLFPSREKMLSGSDTERKDQLCIAGTKVKWGRGGGRRVACQTAVSLSCIEKQKLHE